MIEIATFAWVPEGARGWVKDLRPRWALAEAGLPYRTRLLAPGEQDGPAYRRWQPFGQVPAYRDEEVELFESGAILLRIARRAETLAPGDPQAAAETEAWMFAALNSVEPKVDNLVLPAVFHAGEAWVEGIRPHAERHLDLRLGGLSGWLADRDWLAGGRFGVADIAMATVLRPLEGTPILDAHPAVAAYVARCLARPGFHAAHAAQLADFARAEPARAEASA